MAKKRNKDKKPLFFVTFCKIDLNFWVIIYRNSGTLIMPLTNNGLTAMVERRETIQKAINQINKTMKKTITDLTIMKYDGNRLVITTTTEATKEELQKALDQMNEIMNRTIADVI